MRLPTCIAGDRLGPCVTKECIVFFVGRLMRRLPFALFRRDRRGAVAVLFALLALPLILIVAFATDYGFFIQSQAQLNQAADAAAMHAVRVASNRYQAGGTLADAKAMGQTAGTQWFTAQAGRLGQATITNVQANVTYLSEPGGFSATVTYTGTVSTGLGSFVVPSWNISNKAIAQNQNSFVEFVMLLDNSSSMQIGATSSDIQHMMEITPCASFDASDQGISVTAAGEGFGNYQCTASTNTYDGSPACPLTGLPNPFASSTLAPTGTPSISKGPSCYAFGLTTKFSDGTYPEMGAPCAFACHWDTSKTAGSGNDNYALARGTIGSANPITLRTDVLKAAVNNILTTISTRDAGNNVSVGIYPFDTTAIRSYPSGAEAGTSISSAQTAVGDPPTTANGADTGYAPAVSQASSNYHHNTDLTAVMTQMAAYLNPSGDGLTASTPQKYLLLVTDGFQDAVNSPNTPVAFNTTGCTTIKNNGWIIYVLYLTYSPLMNYQYLEYDMPYVEGTGSGNLTAALQACASPSAATSNYVEASDTASINSTMQTFLDNALNSATRLAK